MGLCKYMRETPGSIRPAGYKYRVEGGEPPTTILPRCSDAARRGSAGGRKEIPLGHTPPSRIYRVPEVWPFELARRDPSLIGGSLVGWLCRYHTDLARHMQCCIDIGRNVGTSPGIRGTSPGIRGTSPGIRGTSPGIRGTSLDTCGGSPPIRKTSSGTGGTSPPLLGVARVTRSRVHHACMLLTWALTWERNAAPGSDAFGSRKPCRRRDSNPRHADYDSAALTS